MDDKENNGLHSIERSNLRGARSRSRSAKKVSSRRARKSDRPMRSEKPRPSRRRGGMMRKLIIIVVAVIGVGVFLISTVFAKTTFELTLATADISVDGRFSAIREPAQSADISYSKQGPYSEIREATVTDITRERQNTRASGTITVHNMNKSGERLDLINRTRFQTADGRIYRLIGKQTIPGGKTIGGEFVPGKREVKVESDAVGDRFNLEEKGVRFSIPGLAKYKEFSETYAISKTTIIGGFSGERFIPNSEEDAKKREQLRREIEVALREKLAQALETNTLTDRIVFSDAVFIEYESLENNQTDSGVVIREKGVLNAISFREADLARLLTKFTTATTPKNESPKKVVGANTSLLLKMDAGEDFDIESSTEFGFSLSGSASLKWEIDEALFVSDVAGSSRSEAEAILLERYPQVVQVNTFDIFPLWRTSIPTNRNKIEVRTTSEGEISSLEGVQ